HPEGFPLAVANIYVDLAASIHGEVRDGLPTAEDGLRSMAAVHQAVASAKADGEWVDARPPMFR
ncbi:MAG: gfo/Idh/MocA family oxidoreductase, partial [Octadecabacter sp.]